MALILGFNISFMLVGAFGSGLAGFPATVVLYLLTGAAINSVALVLTTYNPDDYDVY